MKILIVSLLKRKITPNVAASRPRIIYELIRGLLQKGHEITVLGTGDSDIPGTKLIPIIEKEFVAMPAYENPFYAETSYLVQLAKKIEEIGNDFDIIHNHTYPEFINLLVSQNIKTPIVTTIHAQGTDELDNVLSSFKNTYFVSISQAHKKLFKKTPIYKVVYNGVDTNVYSYSEKKENYLLWLGRLSKAKNADGSFMDPKGIKWAIQLAQQTGEKLILSGYIEDMEFYNKDVEPFLNDKIQWVGPLSSEHPLTRQEIAELMQKAKAYLMTINWYEPFGLVMTEAMSCGTPVIGFDRGSVRELVIDGKTGFIVEPEKGIEGLKDALNKIHTIQPLNCRNHVLNHFSIENMVDSYNQCYKEIIDRLIV